MNAEQRRQWRRHVFGCPELTAAQRLVLLALEGFADYPAGTNAHPGIGQLAGICRMEQRAVKRALTRARELKLIEQTARANPKRGYAAVHRIVSQHISRCTASHLESDFKVTPGTFQGDSEDVSRWPAVPPTNPLTPNQYTERESAATADASHSPLISENEIIDGELVDSEPVDSEPPDYCKAHMPYGTADPCTFCAVARHHKDAWRRRNPNAVLNSLLRELNDNPGPNPFGARHSDCPLCDEHGWLLGDDGSIDDRNIRCTHPTNARSRT